jgi:hypothetical protein
MLRIRASAPPARDRSGTSDAIFGRMTIAFMQPSSLPPDDVGTMTSVYGIIAAVLIAAVVAVLVSLAYAAVRRSRGGRARGA